GPLASIATSGLTLTPAFAPGITDYVLRCQPGTNQIVVTLTATAGGHINVTGHVSLSVNLSERLVENQAFVIMAHSPKNPAGTQFWIRCLPHDFPQLSVNKSGATPAGWYLTANIFGGPTGSSAYAMVLDNNGTPVWYRKPAGTGAINVTPLPNNEIAWASDVGPGFGTNPLGAFEVFN